MGSAFGTIDKFQYFRGYLRIRVRGFSPERFMNLCSNKDILLWNISKENDDYFMNISLKNFYELKGIAKKTGVRVAIQKRYGLPFFTPVMRKRKFFVVGFLLMVFFLQASSMFIWDIELEGNMSITEDVFSDFLKEQNVRVGMQSKKLDIALLEKEIRKKFPDVTWTSAKLSGIRLKISIKESDAPIIKTDKSKDAASNLISEYDGKIVSMIVRSGEPKVSVGDEIAAGDVLVEGMIPIYNDDGTVREYTYVSSDADILLEHEREFVSTLSFYYQKKNYTGREKNRYFIRITDKELKIPFESPYLVYDSIIRFGRPKVFEILGIPIFFGKYTYREYQNVEYKYTLDEAKDILNQKLITFITSLNEKGIQIIDKNVKIDVNGEEWTLNGSFSVWESIGRNVFLDSYEQPFSPYDLGENSDNE